MEIIINNLPGSDSWATAAAWATAAGTLTLAITTVIAIFFNKFWAWIKRPKLRVITTGQPPDCHKIWVVVPENSLLNIPAYNGNAYYLRIRVENFGKRRAEQAEVFADKLLRQQDDGLYVEQEDFLPMNLRWTHIEKPYIQAISPGMKKHCNLGFIIEPSSRPARVSEWLRIRPEQSVLALSTEVQPNILINYLVPGRYILILKTTAANIEEPVSESLEINLNGSWYGAETDMLKKGVSVSVKK